MCTVQYFVYALYNQGGRLLSPENTQESVGARVRNAFLWRIAGWPCVMSNRWWSLSVVMSPRDFSDRHACRVTRDQEHLGSVAGAGRVGEGEGVLLDACGAHFHCRPLTASMYASFACQRRQQQQLVWWRHVNHRWSLLTPPLQPYRPPSPTRPC